MPHTGKASIPSTEEYLKHMRVNIIALSSLTEGLVVGNGNADCAMDRH